MAADVGSASDSSLVSPVIPLGSGAQQLSFKHRFTFETPYDAGVLEIKIGAGSFTDIVTAGGSFVQGGYGASVPSSATGSPLIGRRAWSGSITTTSTVIVNLPPAAANQNVQFRWRVGCDSSSSSTGWSVDTVQVYTTSFSCTSIDSDSDGIPNGWETLYGLSPNDPSDAARDDDGDGLTNLQEYIAGTDPTNAASVLRISSIARDPGTGGFLIGFPTQNGSLYSVEWNDSLTNPNGWVVLQNNLVGTGNEAQVFDPGAVGQPARFYRVRGMR